MPFSAVKELDEERFKDAMERLCAAFGVKELRYFQVQAAKSILQGKSVILDVPTGGGKTLAFWLPLFYFWAEGDSSTASQRTVLVIGPISALLEEQAAELRSKGVPAAALTSNTPNMDSVLQVCSLDSS